MRRITSSAVLSFILLNSCAPVERQAANLVISPAAKLKQFMSGDFVSKLDQDGNRVADFRTSIRSLGKGEWIYYQRNQGTGNLAEQKVAYRQRVLQLVDRSDGSVAQYTWSLKEPGKFASAPRNPEVLQAITLGALTPTMEAGCEQIWRLAMVPTPVSDPGEDGWEGRVDPKQCTVFSKRRNKRIGIGSHTLLTASGLREAERGFELNGTQIWGTPKGQFTNMARVD